MHLNCPLKRGYPAYTTFNCPLKRGYPAYTTLNCPLKRGYPAYTTFNCPLKRGYPAYTTLNCPLKRGYSTYTIVFITEGLTLLEGDYCIGSVNISKFRSFFYFFFFSAILKFGQNYFPLNCGKQYSLKLTSFLYYNLTVSSPHR